MSSTGPFGTYFGLLNRGTHLIEMSRRDEPLIAGYQFWGAGTLNDAYGNPLNSGVGGAGPAALFQVPKGGFFRSPSLKRKGLGVYESNRRGQSTVVFDVDDYPAALGTDDDTAFIRVQENRITTGLVTVAGPAPVLGPIYVIPSPDFFGRMSPVLALQGIAPSATGSSAGVPPVFSLDLTSAGPRPMVLVFPTPLNAVKVQNSAAAGGNDLLVSYGMGQPMVNIPAGGQIDSNTVGRVKFLTLACPDDGGVAFTIVGSPEIL